MKAVKIVYMPDAPSVRVVETADTIYINSATEGGSAHENGQTENA